MISYVLPTRNDAGRLPRTLRRLGTLSRAEHEPLGGMEVVVVDNASPDPVRLPAELSNGAPLRVIRLEQNHGAAGRNAGAELAAGPWIVMLDDDSFPLDAAHVPVLAAAAPDVAAIGAEIMLEQDGREAGGLPEVIVGCGAALRRDAFLAAGGYDRSFEYYVEEYDLCARLIAAGHRVRHDPRFRVLHRKMTAGRDMNAILRRLVRNNGWVIQRYAPEPDRTTMLQRMIDRYRAIAQREDASSGCTRGLSELETTLGQQRRAPLTRAHFDRFTGRAAVHATLARLDPDGRSVELVGRGKHDWIIEQTLAERGVACVDRDGDLLAAGTLSPGPMWDTLDAAPPGRPIVPPYIPHPGLIAASSVRTASTSAHATG